jgi:hypothetical protein
MSIASFVASQAYAEAFLRFMRGRRPSVALVCDGPFVA